VGQKFVWVGQARVWVGHGLPGLIARTASGRRACGRSARRRPGAWAVGQPTLHGGPVRLRPVRATPCLQYVKPACLLLRCPTFCGYTVFVFNQLPGPTQPATLSGNAGWEIITFFSRSLRGRCYGNRFLARIGENGVPPPSFCALTFRNEWED